MGLCVGERRLGLCHIVKGRIDAGYRGTGIQDYRNIGAQRCRSAGVQGYSGAGGSGNGRIRRGKGRENPSIHIDSVVEIMRA